jgi:hypothetical protein
MKGAKACVMVQNDLTDHIEVNKGPKQGDRLALFLHIIVLEYVMSQLSVDINSSLIYKSCQIVCFASDLGLKL